MLVVNSSCGFGSNVDSDRSLFRLLYRPIGQAKNVAFVCDVTNGKKGSQDIQSVLVFVHLFLEKRWQGLESCMVSRWSLCEEGAGAGRVDMIVLRPGCPTDSYVPTSPTGTGGGATMAWCSIVHMC